MEIEAQMAEDRDREANRISKLEDTPRTAVRRPTTSAIKRIATQGAVKRPLTPRIGRGF